MNTTRCLTIAVLACLGTPAFGQVNDGSGAAPAPTLVTVEEIHADRGELICAQLHTQTVIVEKLEIIDEGGVKKQVVKKVPQTVTKKVLERYELKNCEMQTADGKTLTNEDMRKRLRKGTTLLVSLFGKPAPKFLKILRDDTLILITKTQGVPLNPEPLTIPNDRTLPPSVPQPLPPRRDR